MYVNMCKNFRIRDWVIFKIIGPHPHKGAHSVLNIDQKWGNWSQWENSPYRCCSWISIFKMGLLSTDFFRKNLPILLYFIANAKAKFRLLPFLFCHFKNVFSNFVFLTRWSIGAGFWRVIATLLTLRLTGLSSLNLAPWHIQIHAKASTKGREVSFFQLIFS